jgi:hypothetical protein
MAEDLMVVKKALKNHRIQLLARTNVVAAGVNFSPGQMSLPPV